MFRCCLGELVYFGASSMGERGVYVLHINQETPECRTGVIHEMMRG